MQSQEFWAAIGKVSYMIEKEPVRGSYEEWISNIWPEFESMCIQIAKHRYIMEMAAHQCKLEGVFDKVKERNRLFELSEGLGLDPHEFTDIAFERHQALFSKET